VTPPNAVADSAAATSMGEFVLTDGSVSVSSLGVDTVDISITGGIAFIILYGLLFVPRNDLGKYWSSMDGVYSSGATIAFAFDADDDDDDDDADADVAFEMLSLLPQLLPLVTLNCFFTIARFSNVSRLIFKF
jgi:hypothetical protein